MFLLEVDGALVDVDRMWDYVDRLGDDDDDSLSIMTGVALGLRFALDHQDLGRSMLAVYEEVAAAGEGKPPEATEEMMLSFIGDMLDFARREP